MKVKAEDIEEEHRIVRQHKVIEKKKVILMIINHQIEQKKHK